MLSLLSLILCYLIGSAEVVEWCYPSSPTPDDANADANGGYGGGHVPEMLGEQCHINIIDAQYDSPDYILRQCQNTPCLIRNAVPTFWKEAWSLANLTGIYGGIRMKGHTAANQKGTMEILGTFVEKMLFRQRRSERSDTHAPRIWDGLDRFSGLGQRLHESRDNGKLDVKWAYYEGEFWDAYRTSIGLHPLRDRVVPHAIAAHYTTPLVPPIAEAFVAGGPCAGTFVHAHGPAIASLAHGMKRWAFVHPGTDLDTMFVHDTFADSGREFWERLVPRNMHHIPKNVSSVSYMPYNDHPVLLCTQKAGDAIFTPRHWHHATLNIWSSLSSVTEFGTQECNIFSPCEYPDNATDSSRKTAAEAVQKLYSKHRRTYVREENSYPHADL